jgi:hypothetical protein
MCVRYVNEFMRGVSEKKPRSAAAYFGKIQYIHLVCFLLHAALLVQVFKPFKVEEY